MDLTNEIFKERLKVVGEYRLYPGDFLSADGDKIICGKCGKPRYEAGWSNIYKMRIWMIANNDINPKPLEVGNGCACMHYSRMQREFRLYKYNEPEYEKDKYDELVKPLNMKRPRRNFMFDYGKYWMLDSVPQWGLPLYIEDRFYMKNYSDAIELVRTLIRLSGESDEKEFNLLASFFIRGGVGSYKTSMLCCVRNWCLNNTEPVVMISMWNLLKTISKGTKEMNDTVNDVDVLLIDDIGKARLSKEQSDKLESLVCYRKNAGKKTGFASTETFEGLKRKGYSESLVRAIASTVDLPFYIEMSDRNIAKDMEGWL